APGVHLRRGLHRHRRLQRDLPQGVGGAAVQVRDQAVPGAGAVRAAVAVGVTVAGAFATLGLAMRLNWTGAVAGAIYLGAGFAWILAASPDNAGLVGAWLVIGALVGCAIPGLANQVALGRGDLAAPGPGSAGPG